MKLRQFRGLVATLLAEANAFEDKDLMTAVRAKFKNKLRITVKDDLTFSFGEVMTMRSPKTGSKMVRPGVLKKFGRVSQGCRALFANIKKLNAATDTAPTDETESLAPPAQSQFQTEAQPAEAAA